MPRVRTFEFIHAEPYGDKDIIMFVRDRDTGEKCELVVDDFEPYFFIPKDEVDRARGVKGVTRVEGGPDDGRIFKSIEGDEIAKVFLDHPGHTRSAREKFSKTWESDVMYTMRFRIDAGVKDVFKVPQNMLRPDKEDSRYRLSWLAIDPADDIEPQIEPRNFYFDIEVGGEDFCGPYEEELNPITCITAYDNYDDKLITWYWRNDWEVEDEDDTYFDQTTGDILTWEKKKFDSEMKLLANFFEHFGSRDYDVISSWNGDGYDIPYVIRRARILGLKPEKWSPIGIAQDGESDWEQPKVGGIFMNDLQRRWDIVEGGKSTALDYVAEAEVDFSWEQHSSGIQELWENDPELMIEYNAHDVIATKAIDEKAGVTEFFFEKMYRTGTRVEELEKASKVIDYYHMFEAKQSEKLPQKGQYDSADFGGAVVFEPKMEGVDGPVAVLDLSKIYPSIMITLNLAYEKYCGRDLVRVNDHLEFEDTDKNEQGDKVSVTRSYETGDIVNPGNLGKKGRMKLWEKLYDLQADGSLVKTFDWEFEGDTDEGMRVPNGVRVDMEEDGLTVRVLRKMFELRYFYEDQVEELDPSADDYKEKYDRLMNKRQVMKDQINAVYGVMGYHRFRLFRPEMAETVTFVGRNLLEMCRRVVEDRLGHEVIYGDTDSVMVLLENVDDMDEAVEVGKHVGTTVNDSMDEFARNFCGVEDHMFAIEFEKLYERMFQGNKKKRYAGWKIWDEDGGYLESPYLDIKGFEYKRSESPPIVAKLQEAIFHALLRDESPREEVKSIIEEIYLEVKKGRVDVYDVARSPQLSSFDSYDSPPAHAKAALFTNKFFDDVEIGAGDDVFYVYMKDSGYNHDGRSLPDNKYIGITEDMEPPQAKVQCRECEHEWTENNFVKTVQWESECPECGFNHEQCLDDQPFYVDGCRVNWEKYADNVKGKAKQILGNLGWAGDMESMGAQNTADAFKNLAGD